MVHLRYLRLVTAVAVLSLLVLAPSLCPAQPVITIQQFRAVFTPGSFHLYSEGVGGSFNIGRSGGPQVYDFSWVNMGALHTSYNYQVGTLPGVAGHFAADAVTMGDSPAAVEKNPVFLFRNDSAYVLGLASVTPSPRFQHYVPAEILAPFPVVYGAACTQSVEIVDTTYGTGGEVLSVQHGSSLEVTTVDGYGVLKLADRQYQCLRIKKEHRGNGDKEFIFLTREGATMLVGGVPASDPDTGVVSGGAQLLLAPSTADLRPQASLPTDYSLDQNYPNPFNPSTVIRFALPKDGNVKLQVYDITGSLVKTVLDQTMRGGNMEVTWDGTNNSGTKVAAGVYIYRLQASNFVATKKMVMVK